MIDWYLEKGIDLVKGTLVLDKTTRKDVLTHCPRILLGESLGGGASMQLAIR